MASFTKLDSGIVDSSIWAEPAETRVVWITLLAKSDKTGYARLSLSGLQRAANVPMPAVEKALQTLTAPDPDSRTAAEEGRRVIKIEGGWFVVNYEKHRMGALEDAAREFLASKKRDERSKNPPKMSRHVADISASASASVSVQGDKGSGEKGEEKVNPPPVAPPPPVEPPKEDRKVNPPPAKLPELAEHLRTERVLGKWKEWVPFRRAKKSCKDFNLLFKEQIEWLGQFSEEVAFEILSASIRNDWQGLFEPKAGTRAAPKAESPTSRRISLEAEEKRLVSLIETLSQSMQYEWDRTPQKLKSRKEAKARLEVVRAELSKLTQT